MYAINGNHYVAIVGVIVIAIAAGRPIPRDHPMAHNHDSANRQNIERVPANRTID
jgi:hypothetical protein